MMKTNEVKVFVLGIGNVGRNFLEILEHQGELIGSRTGTSTRIVAAADRSASVILDDGVTPARLVDAKKGNGIASLGKEHSIMDILGEGIDVLVDMSSASQDGRRERDLYISAFREGVDVVTANKSPLANHWKEIMDSASSLHSSILYEATVAGGVPLFNLLNYSCGPSSVTAFHGIVSLTANFVMRQMRSGMPFQDAVKRAQAEGIAETKYQDDTDGVDGARKTIILANALFGQQLRLKDFGFSGIGDLATGNITPNARLIADISKDDGGVQVFSGVKELSDEDFLLELGPMSLGYEVTTSNSGKLRMYSMGDTPEETAAAVVNDLMLISRQKFQAKR